MDSPNRDDQDEEYRVATIHDIAQKHEKEEAVIEIGGMVRPPMNQEEFDQKFSYKHPEEEDEFHRRVKKILKSYYEPFTSFNLFKYHLITLIPIFDWLPEYNIKSDLLNDIIGGLTVGIMHVPQGIAYALLAEQDAVVGLYTSFFPPLIYMFFGTSKHNSIGSFAVVSLMTGIAVERLTNINYLMDHNEELANSNSTLIDPITPIQVASVLTLTVGIIQFLMGLFRLSFLTTYFSDQVVAGFTTGASCHVFVSQLKDSFGIRGLPKRNGPGYILLKLYDLIINLHRTNVAALITSLSVMIFLIVGKDILNPRITKKFKMVIPIPYELIVVIFSTLVSYFLNLNGNYKVKIVKHIPTGLPELSIPRISLMPELLADAIGISVVVIAIHISLGKMFAKKLEYNVDPGQELYALGVSSIGSSFLPVYPVACSLGRTLVNVEAGTKTQLSTIFSSILVGAVILYFGKWLETLPMCVLSAVVIVALKGMLNKFSDLRTLWPLSKIDFSIWVVSFVSTVFIDVTEGLAISILFALFTTIMREQWPRWHLLGNVSGTTDYRDSERYQDVYFFHGICMFRFDSPLLFTNVERFKRSVNKAYREWEKSHEFYVLRQERPQLLMETIREEEDGISLPIRKITHSIMSDFSDGHLSRHFIIDCSGFTFVDYMGVSALKEVYSEMRSRGILVYFAAAKAPVRELFEQGGFYSLVAKDNFYPTIRDAVAIARRTQLAHGQTDSLYTPEYDRLSEIISSHPMH